MVQCYRSWGAVYVDYSGFQEKYFVIFKTSVTASAEGTIGHVPPGSQMGRPRQRVCLFVCFFQVRCPVRHRAVATGQGSRFLIPCRESAPSPWEEVWKGVQQGEGLPPGPSGAGMQSGFSQLCPKTEPRWDGGAGLGCCVPGP
ncbi:hypothetical protein HJG60_009657 [Phyllostomus discolor]|uniref:Uncharacterized protein n=1 Tax=Phyllostomus discolor TaxID=89673 RepID=A0A834B6F9_9CHIR|nr:hypothetical protein HJG60_009657 [Phyllostomus discolor]